MPRCIGNPQDQNLGQEPRDVAGAEIDRRDNQPADQVFRSVERADLGVAGFFSQRTKVDPQLVRRLVRPLVGLGAENAADPKIERTEGVSRSDWCGVNEAARPEAR